VWEEAYEQNSGAVVDGAKALENQGLGAFHYGALARVALRITWTKSRTGPRRSGRLFGWAVQPSPLMPWQQLQPRAAAGLSLVLMAVRGCCVHTLYVSA
jgi:hypothetical protein